MLKATLSVAVVIVAMAGVSAPALAAKPLKSCYDFAWESQDQKDCLANPDMLKQHMHHGMKHNAHAKPMKGMDHDMKGMDHDKDMKKS